MAPFSAGNGAVVRDAAGRHVRRNDGRRSDAVRRIATADGADDALEPGGIEDSLADNDADNDAYAFVFFFAKLDGFSSPNTVGNVLPFLLFLSRLLLFNLYVSREISFGFAFSDGRLGLPSGRADRPHLH